MPEPARRRFPALGASELADGASLGDVGRDLGVSSERARQVQAEALRHARERLIERLGEEPARHLGQPSWRSAPITRRG